MTFSVDGKRVTVAGAGIGQRDAGAAGSQQLRGRYELRRRLVSRDGQSGPPSCMVAGLRERVGQPGELGIGALGCVEQPCLTSSRSGRIGGRRIGGAKTKADPGRQRNDDYDRRSAAADGTYHLAVDLDRLRTLPKAELHLHLDGSLRPRTAVELAAKAGQSLTLEDAVARLVGPARCADQAELLSFFDLPISLLQTAAALQRVTAELVETLADDGMTYAEIRWALSVRSLWSSGHATGPGCSGPAA